MSETADDADLTGIRVLNIGRGVAAAYALRLFADVGATCSWWEWQTPAPGEWPGGRVFRNFFESGIDVLGREESQEAVIRSVQTVAYQFDVVISDFNATELPEGELLRCLVSHNRAIVVANADHFGRHGPRSTWVGDEFTDYAVGGYWSLGGQMDKEPLRVPGRQAQFHCGMHLAFSALAAVRHARLTQEGQEVEVSAGEAMLAAHLSSTLAWTHEGRILQRADSDLYRAKDGWVFFNTMFMYPNLAVLLDRPDLLDDPRWSTTESYMAHRSEFWSIVEEWCADKTTEEIVPFGQELRLPVTAMETAETLVQDEQLAARGFFRTVTGSLLPGKAFPWEMSGGSVGVSGRLQELLDRRPAPPAPTPSPGSESPSGNGPLTGVRLLELTDNWAGPIAARHFADLGADVIKVELAAKPAARSSHYPGLDAGKYHWNRSGYFNQMNRNKRDIALNLATPDGRKVFLQLVKWCDVLIENNSARVMPNLGLDYATLAVANPRLVMVSITGFGATGPRRDWVAYGSNIEAACGLAAITGYDEEKPFRTGTYLADPVGGGHAAVAALAALERRDRTGHGTHLDLSLIESLLPFMTESFAYLAEHGEVMPRAGNADPEFAPTGAYRCAGRDDWIAIAVRTDSHWRALCSVALLPFESRLSAHERIGLRQHIDAALTSWTRTQSQLEAAQILQERGIPAAPINNNWQLHSDPHLFARQAFISIDHPDTGVMPFPGFPWSFSLTPPSVRMAAPRFGEANRFVFSEVLRMSQTEIEALYSNKITADTPSDMPIIFA